METVRQERTAVLRLRTLPVVSVFVNALSGCTKLTRKLSISLSDSAGKGPYRKQERKEIKGKKKAGL